MAVRIAILKSDDRDVLTRVAPEVFDNDVRRDLCEEFLRDPRHHLAVAIDSEVVVGMASGVHYVHPDKEPELWINEVAVAPTHRSQGIGQQLLRALLEVGRQSGCVEAWVLTDRSNLPAMRLYQSCGGNADPGDLVMFEFPLREGH